MDRGPEELKRSHSGGDQRACAAAILKANRIAYSRLERCGDGNLNQVFMADGKHIIRFSDDKAGFERLEAEARLIGYLRDILPTREVISCGKLDRNAYQILRFVEGASLADCWASLDSKQKDRIIRELVDYLRALHHIRFDDFGYLCLPESGHSNYRDFRVTEFEWIVSEISCDPRINAPAIALEVYLDFFREKSACFKEEEATLVHNDLWLGNILVHGDRITAIIDFELAVKAPPDAEIHKIDCFCARPEIFSKYSNYADFMVMFREYYPELFEGSPDLATRTDLHELTSLWKGYLFETQTGKIDPDVCSQPLTRLSDEIISGKTVKLF